MEVHPELLEDGGTAPGVRVASHGPSQATARARKKRSNGAQPGDQCAGRPVGDAGEAMLQVVSDVRDLARLKPDGREAAIALDGA